MVTEDEQTILNYGKPACYPHFVFFFVDPDEEPFCEMPDASEGRPASCSAVWLSRISSSSCTALISFIKISFTMSTSDCRKE